MDELEHREDMERLKKQTAKPAKIAERPLNPIAVAAPFAVQWWPQVVAVVKGDFGHGVTPSDGRMLYDLIGD